MKNAFIKFFLLVASLVLLFTTANPVTQLIYKINLPIFSTSSPTLSIFIFTFSVAVIGGFGIDIFRKGKSLRKVIISILAILFIFLVVWIVVQVLPKAVFSFRNLIYSTFIASLASLLLLVGMVRRKILNSIVILLLLLNIGDLFYFFQKFNPFVPGEFIFPKAKILEFLQKEAGVNRFWGYGTAAIEANFATQYQLFSPDGYDPLHPARYGEFIQGSKDGTIKTEFTYQTRSDAVVAPGFGKDGLPENPYRLRVLDVLGVRYVFDRIENGSTERTFPPSRFKLIYEENGWRIFENLKTLPRAFLVSDYKAVKTAGEFEDIFFAKDFNLSTTIILEDELIDGLNRTSEMDSVSIVSYNPNKVVITTKADSQKLLFLSDTYYPGWKASVDGQQTKIYRANYAFRAIRVPKGRHSVVFVYEPESFSLGGKISIVSFLSTVLLIAFISKWQQKHKS